MRERARERNCEAKKAKSRTSRKHFYEAVLSVWLSLRPAFTFVFAVETTLSLRSSGCLSLFIFLFHFLDSHVVVVVVVVVVGVVVVAVVVVVVAAADSVVEVVVARFLRTAQLKNMLSKY